MDDHMVNFIPTIQQPKQTEPGQRSIYQADIEQDNKLLKI